MTKTHIKLTTSSGEPMFFSPPILMGATFTYEGGKTFIYPNYVHSDRYFVAKESPEKIEKLIQQFKPKEKQL